jgi:hypothetical protein
MIATAGLSLVPLASVQPTGATVPRSVPSPPDEPQTGLITGWSVTGGQDPAARVWEVEPAAAGAEAPAAPQAPVREKVCSVYELPGAAVSGERAIRDQLGQAVDAMVPQGWYYLECRWVDDDTVDYADFWQFVPGQPGAGPSADALARQAYDQVPLVVPQPRTAPPAGGEQLVGFPIWLWVEPAAWQTFTAEATVPGLSVTVTATPRQLAWDMGDGTQLTCTGPGTPWLPDGGDDQTTDCSHAYQFVSAHESSGRYHVTATVTWGVTWQASTGESGTLADATRTAAFALDVGERQAVIAYGSS